jgi:hypothetical protein
MSFPRFSRLFAIAACLAAVVLTGGCFEYNEEISLRDDGTGTVHIHGWIDGEVIKDLYTGDPDSPPTTPMSAGVVTQLIAGTTGVEREEFSMVRDGDRWAFDTVIAFTDIKSLAKTSYFKWRKLSLKYSGAKEVTFRSTIEKNLLAMARDRHDLYEQGPYGEKFLAAVDTPEFLAKVAEGTLTYTFELEAALAEAQDGAVSPVGNGRQVAKWQYKMADILAAEQPPTQKLFAVLPQEENFAEVVMLILVLSIVGILVSAIRLLMLKVKGVS